MNIRAIYKCSLCDTKFTIGNAVNVPYDKLPDLLGRVIRTQMFMGNPALYEFPMHVPHKCADGRSAGLAQFIGFKEV